MAAYAALLSLAHTTDVYSTFQDKSLFSSDAEEKVRSIHGYVNFLLSFFKEFPKKVNRWECRIRDVAYKIQDIIDVFLWQRLQSTHRAMNPSRVKLEDQLQIVMEEIGLITGEVMEERPAYLPSSSSTSTPATPGSDALIGLEDDIMAIKERLCGQSSRLQFIPIVGMGGIGKTTLARTVYDDQLIIESFDLRAWVVVSQDYSPHRFRKNLFDSLKLLGAQTSRDEMDDSEIELKVYQHLKFRRYLVVIDDVWGTNVLDDVKHMFPNDDNGSRIILTTRQWDVDFYGSRHEMQFMKASQSWDLLKQKVFPNSYCPPELEDVGKDIARRCAGLPLALVLVAGVLSPVNKTRASWEEIAKNVNPVVGEELEVMLSLSYNYLPHYLRPCFLFIGGFLEDVNIRTSRLIRLWVAEGFLMHQNGCSKSLEEEAEEYLEDLVKRNLVIVTSRKSDGRIKSCSLHDMVRDFCIKKAREEQFLHVMDGHNPPQCLMNERRISFSRSDIDEIWGPTFRTILCFQTQMLPQKLGSYKLLRVFDALGVDLKELPSEVFELYHLRYLALMGFFRIPSAVSHLVNLQTLIIHLRFGKPRGKYDHGVPHSLPLEIWRLPQLRHLFFHGPYLLPHPREGFKLHLGNLQTLSLVANLVWNEKILQMLPNVKRLGLTYTINQEYHLHHLKDLHQLEKLEVIGNPDYKFFMERKDPPIFSWRGHNPSFPFALKKLTLVGGGFPWEDMAIVGSLPNLEVLKLLGNSCDGVTWETTDEEFPRLKVLQIEESRLCEWITQSNPLPTLKCLVLHSCLYLREIPEGIGKIPTLEVIDIKECSYSLVESAMNIDEDQKNDGNYDLQVRIDHEEIQTFCERNVVIGLEEDLIIIKKKLCGQSSELQVISIMGIGGIGKTTLARIAYYDPLILEHFDIRVWLTLSQDYSPLWFRKILLGILNSMELLDEKMSGEMIDDESAIQTKIYQSLMGRKYLFVMDDIWSSQDLDAFTNIFPNDGNGSRILLTARSEDVDLYTNLGTFRHQMFSMGRYRSWRLLKKMVFDNRNCPRDLEKVGREIAKGCKGIPLAIVLVAGVLVSAVDKTQAFWYEIAQRENLDVLIVLQEILDLSYTHLPHHLRPCFLHMGVFPEYQNIDASILFKSWVDEGFLKCDKSLEEEADEYLDDLVKRNLVTVTSRKNNGKINSCSLHDMVREFCIRKAWEQRFSDTSMEAEEHSLEDNEEAVEIPIIQDNILNMTTTLLLPSRWQGLHMVPMVEISGYAFHMV